MRPSLELTKELRVKAEEEPVGSDWRQKWEENERKNENERER